MFLKSIDNLGIARHFLSVAFDPVFGEILKSWHLFALVEEIERLFIRKPLALYRPISWILSGSVKFEHMRQAFHLNIWIFRYSFFIVFWAFFCGHHGPVVDIDCQLPQTKILIRPLLLLIFLFLHWFLIFQHTCFNLDAF